MPLMRRRAMRQAMGDDGFSLIEVVVALVVMAIILGSLGYTIGVRVSTVSSSRNEQTAEGLLTKALAEVRAMPYTTVKHGLTTSTTTTTPTTKTFIKKHGAPTTSKWTFTDPGVTGSGETIPHANFTTNPPPPPLHPQRTSDVTKTINGVQYTVTTIPTQYVNTAPKVTSTKGVIRITVIVTWTGQGHGSSTTLLGQTIVYSATALGNTTFTTKTNPLAAPYQPNFTASATTGAGSIQLRPVPTPGTTPPIEGVPHANLTSLSLSLDGAFSYSAFIQTSSVLGWTRSTGAILNGRTGTNEGTLVTSSASSDPSSSTGTFESKSMTSSTSRVSLTATNGSGERNSINVTPSDGDTGTAISTASASTTQGCTNIAGTKLATGLPCGSSKATQTTTATVKANLYAGTHNVEKTVVLASVAKGPSPDRSFSARYGAKSITTCPSTRTRGCATAGARMYLGKVTLAGLPTAFKPAGWKTTTNLVSLTTYSATVSSWAKSGNTTGHVTDAYKVPVAGAPTPKLSYYNGSGYTTVTLKGTAVTMTIPPVVSTKSVAAGVTVTISISATLAVRGHLTTSFVTTKTCVAACGVTESVGSPVTGTITYKVTTGATVIADLVITVNLGSVSSRTTYQEPT